MRLEAVSETTADVISEWTMSMRLPLVGSSLERIAGEETRLRLQAECDASDQLMMGV